MITDFQANQWLDTLQDVWLACHSADPEINGDLATEISGGGYERVSARFTDAEQRIIWNQDAAKFRGMPACTVAYIAGWSQQFNGRMLWYVPADEEERVQAGNTYVVKAGTIAISIG